MRTALPALDRLAVIYLVLPLLVFIATWLQAWIAVPLLACAAHALRGLAGGAAASDAPSVSATQLAVVIPVAVLWTGLGGTGHFVFANFDWYLRDAVLHDLVVSPWPVGYGAPGVGEVVLRAPIAYYLPAALAGKAFGLGAAHVALAAWTGLGVALFLLQVASLVPSRVRDVAALVLTIVLFSGLDIVGNLINIGPRFIALWHIENHLEWWAGTFQYSSMTTQLFWVPNHALGGWLTVGLLLRGGRNRRVDELLPAVVVADLLWSPLTTLGIVPFALYRAGLAMWRDRSLWLLDPRVWAPALAVGIVVVVYLTQGAAAIPHGLGDGGGREALGDGLLRDLQFFLLEAGLIGFAVLSLRPGAPVVLALLVLLLLPFVHFGPSNDLVMRASIPSLTVLAIAAALALQQPLQQPGDRGKKAILAALLAVGAVTAVQEVARALRLPAWPINRQATLVGVSCGHLPPHYVAQFTGLPGRMLREPHRIEPGPIGRAVCTNPALMLMYRRGLLDS